MAAVPELSTVSELPDLREVAVMGADLQADAGARDGRARV